MGQKKGIVPIHIQPKKFIHPGEDSPWIVVLSQVEDPRKPSCNTRHSVVGILFIVFIAVLCGAGNWEEIYHLAEGIKKWLGKYIDLAEGVPSKWTLERVISLIPTEELHPLFKQFSDLAKRKGTVAIDGKTLRGTNNKDKKSCLHLLHAWSVGEALCIGQLPVREKSNEITAFPDLLSELDLKKAVITADALNTQKENVRAIVEKEADYVLPVKKNHRSLMEDIELLFTDADRQEFRGIDAAEKVTTEKTGGRVEKRSYKLLSGEELPGIEEWVNCRCVGRVKRERSKGGKIQEETCYYITSLDFDIEQFAKSVRDHWRVENNLHWSLDVIFREDHHRYYKKLGAANLSAMRKAALVVLRRDKSVKCGSATKQVKALASDDYREHLLKNCF